MTSFGYTWQPCHEWIMLPNANGNGCENLNSTV